MLRSLYDNSEELRVSNFNMLNNLTTLVNDERNRVIGLVPEEYREILIQSFNPIRGPFDTSPFDINPSDNFRPIDNRLINYYHWLSLLYIKNSIYNEFLLYGRIPRVSFLIDIWLS
jgi:hypothetical protein